MEVGKKYRIFWNKDNPLNGTIHIRAIVDDNQVVYKEWSPGKQRYFYFVRDMMWFDMLKKDGVIKKIR